MTEIIISFLIGLILGATGSGFIVYNIAPKEINNITHVTHDTQITTKQQTLTKTFTGQVTAIVQDDKKVLENVHINLNDVTNISFTITTNTNFEKWITN